MWPTKVCFLYLRNGIFCFVFWMFLITLVMYSIFSLNSVINKGIFPISSKWNILFRFLNDFEHCCIVFFQKCDDLPYVFPLHVCFPESWQLLDNCLTIAWRFGWQFPHCAPLETPPHGFRSASEADKQSCVSVWIVAATGPVRCNAPLIRKCAQFYRFPRLVLPFLCLWV